MPSVLLPRATTSGRGGSSGVPSTASPLSLRTYVSTGVLGIPSYLLTTSSLEHRHSRQDADNSRITRFAVPHAHCPRDIIDKYPSPHRDRRPRGRTRSRQAPRGRRRPPRTRQPLRVGLHAIVILVRPPPDPRLPTISMLSSECVAPRRTPAAGASAGTRTICRSTPVVPAAGAPWPSLRPCVRLGLRLRRTGA